MKKPFGTTLNELMQNRKLSSRALAELLGVPYRTVQEWIGPGNRIPRDPGVLKKLAEHFQCSVHYLLFGVEDPNSILSEILDKSEIHTGLYEITIKRVKTRGNNKP